MGLKKAKEELLAYPGHKFSIPQVMLFALCAGLAVVGVFVTLYAILFPVLALI